MTTTYQHTQFSAAKDVLAQRLGDPSKRFHVDEELGWVITEARRMWNLATAFDRARGMFISVSDTPFYDLQTLLKDSGGTLLREQTIRDRDILSQIEYQLMEKQNFSGWTGTDQFTLSQITSAIQRRRNQFLADTAAVVSVHPPIMVAGGDSGTIDLPDTVIGIRRAVFKTSSGRYWTLRPTSESNVVIANQRQSTHGIPTAYSVTTSPELTVQLSPPPAESGQLELLVVYSGAEVDVTANGDLGTLLGVPDDAVWGVKYGALGDLLSSFRSTDPARVDFCLQMYDLAVKLTVNMPVVLNGELDGQFVSPASMTITDSLRGGWQSQSTGAPTVLSIAGPNLVGLTPLPDGNPHSVLLDVVRTAIVPVEDTDYLQIGRESLDAILGMAQHVSMFKLGGAEFEMTTPLSLQFFTQAQKYSYRRSAASAALQDMLRSSQRELANNSWEHVPVTVTDGDEVKSERNARRRPFRQSQRG